MPTLPFASYSPDTNDLDGQTTKSLLNVIPRSDGYGPFRALEPWTSALPSRCRGMFYARNTDGTVSVFAGTIDGLYKLNNTTFSWDDVSDSGGYTDLSTDEHWQFAQFGNLVIAVQGNEAPQSFNLSSSTDFAALAGSPPQARYVAVVNRFIVLFGLASNVFRVQWSGLNDAINWTAGTGSSDYQDLPDGGIPRGVVGGDLGFILQDAAIRRMTFAAGSDIVFQIDKIAKDVGVLAPYSLINAGPSIFFISALGFMKLDPQGGLTPIGEERINRTFLEDYDDGALGFVLGAADPNSNTVVWMYRSAGFGGDAFDSGFLYNYVLDRFSPLSFEGQYIASLAQPGLSLEALDAIAPGALTITGTASGTSSRVRITVSSTTGITTGDYKTISAVLGTTEANGTWSVNVIDATHLDLVGTTYANAYVSGGIVGGSLDLLPFSLDSIQAASLPNISAVTTSGEVGFFTGDNLEATLETAEQSLDGQRIQVNGFYPVTDAPTVYGRVSKRENLNEEITYTNESTMNARGFCAMIRSTRYSRGAIRIPASTVWTYAKGLRPDVRADGEI
jgi:hypothetical protein